MKNILLLLLIVTLTKVNGQNSSINLIPQPVEIKQNKGTYQLKAVTNISFNKAESQKVAGMLAHNLNTPTGLNLKVQQGISGAIQLNLNEIANPRLGKEGYTLESTTKGVIIRANETAGLFYGTQTLMKLLPKEIESKEVTKGNWVISAVKITDYPRFAWRGLMLDVSRHFFPKSYIKKFIEHMVKYKYNVFHWHLSDDTGWRIEIKQYPKLTEVGAWRVPRTGKWGSYEGPDLGEAATDGGYYTQQDIKEIVKYAQDRFVTIVPEIDIPGHSQALIAAYPTSSCTGEQYIVFPGSNSGMGANGIWTTKVKGDFISANSMVDYTFSAQNGDVGESIKPLSIIRGMTGAG